MRSSLVVAGGIITITGVGLFAALDGEAWLVLIAGGAVVLAAGFALKEVPNNRVEPPPGHQFCPFCTTLVKEGTARCPHCNGLQEWPTQPNPTAPQPNN
jgi:hypothetical protein